MANFCLLPDKIGDFKKALKEKEISLPSLLNMGHADLVKTFEPYAGKSAEQVATAFEEKLILKNRMVGIRNLFSKLGEVGKYSEAGKAKLAKAQAEYRAAQVERILSPAENQTYLQGLADKLLGEGITQEEAKNVFDLTGKTQELLTKFDKENLTWESPQARADYGAAKVQLENYVSQLKGEGEPFKEIIKGRVEEFKKTFETNPAKAVFDVGADGLKAISDNSIALVASVDNSFLGRQGGKVLLTNPSAWWEGASNSFINIYKELGGHNAMNALMANVYSDPLYINGEYEKAGIISTTEEQYPTSLPERIPGVGRVFKASEVAFKGSALQMRMKLYNLTRDLAIKQGVKMTDTQIKDIGTVINSLTARGKFGKYGESPIIKLVFWAPRMIKANYDVLTGHSLGAGLETPFARKLAAKNLLKILGAISLFSAMVYGISKKGKVGIELNPTSTNFLNVSAEDTKLTRMIGSLADFVGINSNQSSGKSYFNVTFGLNSIVTLVARQKMGESKNSATGVTTKFGSGFGETSRFDAFVQFLTGKTTPAVKVLIDFSKGVNYQGQKPTILDETYGITVPISVQNIIGIFGSSSIKQDNWNDISSKELMQFRAKIGQEKFNQANEQYNNEYQKKFADLIANKEFQAKTDEDKKKALTKIKTIIKSSILSQYDFKYKQSK